MSQLHYEGVNGVIIQGKVGLMNGGDKTSLILLIVHSFLYSFNQFMIVPELFWYAKLVGYSPTSAGLLLGVSPLSACVATSFINCFH